MHGDQFCNEIFVSDTNEHQSNCDLLLCNVLKSSLCSMSGMYVSRRERWCQSRYLSEWGIWSVWSRGRYFPIGYGKIRGLITLIV